uniref:NADH-ubiquinone oxidoreductase chain 4L n=1 Tax=Lepas anserifera TaxID=245079 RepID=A0A0C5BWW3_9CRUS|nr:NADH dehydrogenase subunit 4L [Lepas anserifera]AJN90590.1 NADH dehydrogenase subunit 4L [Lepas anserifera]
MLNILISMPTFLMLVGIWVFVSKRNHLMNMLISLEYIALMGFFLILMTSFFSGFENYLGMVFLISSVCEGSLGVSILVSMVRSHGSDHISVLSALSS